MTNKDVCEYVEKLPEHKTDGDYICDLFVKAGYGQSTNGYLGNKVIDYKNAEPSQKIHFVNYLKGKTKENEKKMKQDNPTYDSLHCPQLMLYIAEIAGVPIKRIKAASELIKEYEDKNKLRNRVDKDGNYVRVTEEFREFKSKIHISELVKIIINAKDWDEVREKAAKL